MSDSYIVFGGPKYSREEILDVCDSMEKGWIGTGPKVKKFEKDFASYIGVEDCVAVNSCTAGLHLSLLEAGIKIGDEVITTAMTFCSTVNTIIHVGATPVLADINQFTWNITKESIENKITSRTKAIVVVHFAGRACEIVEIRKLADQHELVLIEDCAHAIETKIEGRHVGTFGDFAAFSFYSTKNISAGEGGVIISNGGRRSLENLRQRSLHGMDKDAYKRFAEDGNAEYDVTSVGFKYNMMDLQAAIALNQLKNVEPWHQRRSLVWKHYMNEFQELPILLPDEIYENEVHAFHLFQIILQPKDDPKVYRMGFRDKLHQKGIGTGIHYKPIASFSIYKNLFNWNEKEWPSSKYFGERTLSVPLSPHLTDSEIERVISAVKEACYDSARS